MKQRLHWRRFASVCGTALLFAVLLTVMLSWSASGAPRPASISLPTLSNAGPAPEDEVSAAWSRLRDLGVYDMGADLTQTRHPAPTVANAGQVARTTRMRLEGHVDLPADQMALQVWPQGGSVATGDGALEVEVKGGKARGRAAGQPWQDLNGFPGMFAPGNDFLSFLSGAADVQRAGTEVRAGVTFTRYTFRLDGPSFGRYVEEQMQAARAQERPLPPGLTVQAPDSYRQLQGTGELWVDTDGLPLRELVQFTVPESSGSLVEANLKVDFRPKQGQASAVPAGAGLATMTAGAARRGVDVLGLAGVAVLAGGLVLTRRSRKTYAVVVAAVVLSMVVSPLAQSVQAASYLQDQAQKQDAADESAHEAELAQARQDAGTRPGFDPQVNPLQQARAAAAAEFAAVSGLPAPMSVASTSPALAAATLAGSTLDSDNDGLTDEEEARLNTNPNSADTDLDSLKDGEEVAGFVLGGKTWYTDPLMGDTNNDGVGDGEEWARDTDNDGQPDIAETDNDNDGVPDDLDLSPDVPGSQTFSATSPLNLVLNSLEPGEPTYVEFQLRPTNPQHLWFAMNVFDWPENDRQGQIQDVDGASLYDACVADAAAKGKNPLTECDAAGPDVNGDMKLIPMLEIRMTGQVTNLPSKADLELYGVYTRTLSTTGPVTAAYVPVQVTSDKHGDARVAFYAKMLYRPESTWGNPQQVRLIWAVQGLTDNCETYTDGQCTKYEKTNELEIIQTYDDTWQLTGFNVREDRGAQVAIAFEDPDLWSKSTDFGPLAVLAQGLDVTFLSNHLDENNQPTFPFEKIRTNFDHTVNASVPKYPDRWNIEYDVFLVDNHDFEHLDKALQSVAMTDTKEILDNHFTSHWSQAAPITPTLLFAREEKFRPLNLDAQVLDPDKGLISWSGNSLTANLTGSSGAIPVNTVRGVSWAPFAYQGGSWAAAPIDDFVGTTLAQLYPLEVFGTPDDEARGRQATVFIMYETLYQGVTSLVALGDVQLEVSGALSNQEVATEFTAPFNAMNTVIKWATDICARLIDKVASVKDIFTTILGAWKGGPVKWLGDPGAMGIVTAVINLIATLGMFIIGLIPGAQDWFKTNAGKALKITVAALTVITALMRTISQITKALLELVKVVFGAKPNVSGLIRGWVKTSFIVGLVFTIIAAIAAIVAFIVTVVSASISGVALADAFAALFAQIAVMILYFLISLIPFIGPLLVALLGLVDTILGAILGPDKTVSSYLAQGIKWWIFGMDVMVSLDTDAQIDGLNVTDPNKGLVVGNTAVVSMSIAYTATHAKAETSPWPLWFKSEYNADALKSTTIKSCMSRANAPGDCANLKASKFEMQNDWINWHDEFKWVLHNMQQANTKPYPLVSPPTRLDYAGLNRTVPLQLVVATNVPVIECWHFIPGLPICGRAHYSAENQAVDISQGLVIDVLPATVDEFAAWNWDSRLGVARDRDGDGLLAGAWGGSDPNDTIWDTDGDGLSDTYELKQRSSGLALNPAAPDTDGDGYKDGTEIRVNSDPTLRDSDGDGLTDVFEITGWTVTLPTGKTVWLHSDPLRTDADGDNISDKAEYELTLGTGAFYDPWTPDPSPAELSAQAGGGYYKGTIPIIAPGGGIPYTATVSNNSASQLYIKGTLSTTLPSVLKSGVQATTFAMLGMGQKTDLHSTVSAVDGVGSQQATVLNQVCAARDFSIAKLPLDEAAGSTTFRDASGNLHVGRCYAGCPAANGMQRAGRPAANFNQNPVILDNSSSQLSFAGTRPFSLAFWIYHPSSDTSTFGAVIQKGGRFVGTTSKVWYSEWEVMVDDQGYVGFERYDGNDAAVWALLPYDTWTHVAVTLDGATSRLYLNGALQMSAPMGSVPAVLNGPVIIGGAGWNNPAVPFWSYFKGALQDLVLYDRTLSKTEVYALYAGVNAQAASRQGTPAAVEPASAPPGCDLWQEKSDVFQIDNDGATANLTSLAADQYTNVTSTLVLAGNASDPTSWVRWVEVKVDAGAWQQATGTESWAYDWNTAAYGEGAHTISTRAYDIFGRTGAVAGTTVRIDRTPPNATTPIVNFTKAAAKPDGLGGWTVHLNGSVTDNLSGVASVEVLLAGQDDVAGRNWQAAMLGTGGAWSLDYRLPGFNNKGEGMLESTGIYLFYMRATDNIGNQTPESQYHGIIVQVDNSPPVAEITATGPDTTTITSAVTLAGSFVDPGSVSKGLRGSTNLQVAFLPAPQADIYSGAVAQMHFDEPAGNLVFADESGGGNAGACANATTCPVAGTAAQVDTGVSFDGVDDLVRIPDRDNINFARTQDFSVAFWVSANAVQPQTKYPDVVMVEKWAGSYGYPFAIRYNRANGTVYGVRWDGTHGPAVTSTGAVNDGKFHHVAFVKRGTMIYLYLDGKLQASTTDTTTASTQNSSPLYLGARSTAAGTQFKGVLDELVILPRGLSGEEVGTLYDAGRVTWQAASVVVPATDAITQTTWSLPVPASLEGLYQIDVRGTDAAGNRNDKRSDWSGWRGPIDEVAPRMGITVTVQGYGTAATTKYDCDAVDFGLSDPAAAGYNFKCPCANTTWQRTTYDQVSQWYRDTFTDTTRLYHLAATCTMAGALTNPVSVYACDVYGHCLERAAGAATLAQAQTLAAAQSSVAVLTPGAGTVITRTAPISVTGGAYAPASLKKITALVDGQPFYTQQWSPNQVTDAGWAGTWLSPTEGSHVLEARAEDWAGGVVTSAPVTVTVATAPPGVDISPLVLTAGAALPGGRVRLSGRLAGGGGFASVLVQVDGGPWQAAAVLGNQWQLPWPVGSGGDGARHAVHVQALDRAGRTVTAAAEVTVDIMPPAPVEVSMGYRDASGQRHMLQAGQTLRERPASLVMSWTSSSDGSGIASYVSGWTTDPEHISGLGTAAAVSAEKGQLRAVRHAPDAAEDVQAVAETLEGVALYAYVIIADMLGNEWQTVEGPIYLDTPQTPDRVLLGAPGAGSTYRGWEESGCSLVGVARTPSDMIYGSKGLAAAQRLLMTWNEQALRMAWKGADWEGDGDLFLYLDTGTGGASSAYDPYPGAEGRPVLDLPQVRGQPMTARYLVWVQDTTTAELLKWDGAAWQVIADLAAPVAGGEVGYRLDRSSWPVVTDLYLPFDLLGITDPAATPLRLVALASAEGALAPWATMPPRNPLSGLYSDAASKLAGLHFPLTQGMGWDSLGSAICPNKGRAALADLDINITSDGGGLQVDFLQLGLNDQLKPGSWVEMGPDGKPVLNLPVGFSLHPLHAGQVVHYTLHYANHGQETAPGVKVTLETRGGLRLSGAATQELTLGDLAPGAQGTIQFEAAADGGSERAGVLKASVADANADFNWIWFGHLIDRAGPVDVTITAPEKYLRPGVNEIRGHARDLSGVAEVEVNVRSAGLGDQTAGCQLAGTGDGAWTCKIQLAGGTDGEAVELRARAKDTLGQWGEWGEAAALTYDAAPPQMALDAVTLSTLQSGLIGPSKATLSGWITDTLAAGGVSVCRGETCGQAPVQPGGAWSYRLQDLGALDGVSVTLGLRPFDAAGNEAPVTEYPVRLDGVTPVVTTTVALDRVALGDYRPGGRGGPVLAGTATDGGGIEVIYVLVNTPAGRYWEVAALDGEQWSYTPELVRTGEHQLQVYVYDRAGNVKVAGPYTLQVSGTIGDKRTYLPILMK